MVACNYLTKLTLISSCLILIGFLVHFMLPTLIERIINDQLIIKPGTQGYLNWRKVPVPIYQRFYFFNVTNAQDIERNGAKPILEEVGPFTYRANFVKHEIESKHGGERMAFKQTKTWHFEPKLSIADHELKIITVNAPLAITLTLIQSAPSPVRLLVTFSLDGLAEGLFTRRSIRQLLFDGYPDLLTTVGPLLNADMLSQQGQFGYMNARNNTLDGTYEVNSGSGGGGETRLNKLNTLTSYNGRPELTYWGKSGSSCNSLAGATTGELFPPISTYQVAEEQEREDLSEPISHANTNNNQPKIPSTIRLFQPDFCRVWPLDLDQRYEDSSGLRLARFRATRDIFKNSTDFPSNACYFPHLPQDSSGSGHSQQQQQHQSTAESRNHHQNRLPRLRQSSRQSARSTSSSSSGGREQQGKVRQEWPAGVFTLGPCKFNAPIYVSMPHFLDADPYFNSQVVGLESDRAKHEFYIDLEPRTGSPVMLKARIQINVAISKPPGLVRFRNIPEIMFPIFWQELSVNVTDNEHVVEQLLLASRKVDDYTQLFCFSLLFFGSLILILANVFRFYVKLVSNKNKETTTITTSS